jgi:hypothetical protein
MFTTLFVVSSVSTLTHGLEWSLDIALGSDGRSILGRVGFISDWVFSRVHRQWISSYAL